MTTPLQAYKGDSLVLKFQVKLDGAVVDITGWDIVAEIWDANCNILKKATAGVPGGADSQILTTFPTLGKFELYILEGETLPFEMNADIEVANITGATHDTLYRAQLVLATAKIDWTAIP